MNTGGIEPAIGVDLSSKDESTVFESVNTHTYTVRPVTRYVVTHSFWQSNPFIAGHAYNELCECTSREEAERIASLLASKAGKVA